jgi:divalent metal cation (Fe/Co/Zn/Cd) transporter
VIWRFTGSRRVSEHAERQAQKLVAVSFFLLAPYIAQDAIRALVAGDHATTSWVGVGLSVSSLAIMPLLGRAKHRVGAQLGSAATAGEGTQNLLCAYLAGGVLVGLLANAIFGLWWLDPVIAVGIAAVAIREGRETWNGEGCCSESPLDRCEC